MIGPVFGIVGFLWGDHVARRRGGKTVDRSGRAQASPSPSVCSAPSLASPKPGFRGAA